MKSASIFASMCRSGVKSTSQGVLVLDGLDTSVLHDERQGVMAPVK